MKLPLARIAACSITVRYKVPDQCVWSNCVLHSCAYCILSNISASNQTYLAQHPLQRTTNANLQYRTSFACLLSFTAGFVGPANVGK